MEEYDALKQLIDKLLIAIEAPIAHSYGIAELAQHELANEPIDIQQIKGDIGKVTVNLNRVLLYIQDFSDEYTHLKS